MIPSKSGTGWQIWTTTPNTPPQRTNRLSHQHLFGSENPGANFFCMSQHTNVSYTQVALHTPLWTGEHQFDFEMEDGKMLTVVSFVKEKADTLKEDECILGFVQSCKEAEALVHLLGCGYYHGKLDDTAWAEVVKSWDSNFGSPILIATNTFSASVDYNLPLVSHYGSPWNHIDQSQESGCIGQNGKAGKFMPKLKVGESDIGIKEQQAWLHTDQCLRIISSKFLDGWWQSCIDLSTVTLCGWCSAQVHPNITWSKHILGGDWM